MTGKYRSGNCTAFDICFWLLAGIFLTGFTYPEYEAAKVIESRGTVVHERGFEADQLNYTVNISSSEVYTGGVVLINVWVEDPEPNPDISDNFEIVFKI